MIETIIIKSVIFLVGICTVFGFGFFKGKKSAEIKQLKNNLEDQLNLRKGRLIVGTIIFLLLNAGCKSTSVNNLCLWANPITITKSELDFLSKETLRQTVNFNQEFEERCGG